MNKEIITENWKARLLVRGDKYGATGSLTCEDNQVEFYDITANKASFPDGQFVGRYYLETLATDDEYSPSLINIAKENGMFSLDNSVSKWTIYGEELKEIGEWIDYHYSIEKTSSERYVVGQDFNTKDWFIYDNNIDSYVCFCDTKAECDKIVSKALEPVKENTSLYDVDEIKNMLMDMYSPQLAEDITKAITNHCKDYSLEKNEKINSNMDSANMPKLEPKDVATKEATEAVQNDRELDK